MDEAEFFLRIVRKRGELARVLQPEIYAEQTPTIEKLNRFGVGHGL
jgi:hypothetical protein